MKIWKNSILIILIVSLLISISASISAETITDDTNDVYYYTFNAQNGKYSLSTKNIQDKGHVDIISASYEIDGNTLNMSMTVSEEIPGFSMMSTCTYILYYGDPDNTNNGWHTASYISTGTATYQTIEGGTQNIGYLTDPISDDGKTFSASFEIQTTNPDFEFWATAMEIQTDISNIDPENPQNFETKTYVDVAPFGPGEWSGSMFLPKGGSSSADDDNGGGRPGFEILTLIVAVGIFFIIIKRKKYKTL